jgi:hypothetical protein
LPEKKAGFGPLFYFRELDVHGRGRGLIAFPVGVLSPAGPFSGAQKIRMPLPVLCAATTPE